MMLWRCELKKLLVVHKGIWILLACMAVKAVFLCAFPELKDSRIVLSQRQYDKYLAQLHGENTPEKSDFILTEYETFKEIISMKVEMQERHQRGELKEDEWSEYSDALGRAELRFNSATIFWEKANQFIEQPTEFPPAHYIYEYGWQTVYTLLQFPDVFLLFGLLLLAAQCFSAEAAGGMLPVLLAARDGRRRLYTAKLLALLAVVLGGTAVSVGLETAIFHYRGWWNDAFAPIYSISILSTCPLDLSLMDGYSLCTAVRALTAALFASMAYGLSVWLKNTANLVFTGICVLAIPMLWSGAEALNTHSGLLSGTRMLLWLGESNQPLVLPLVIVAVYSVTIVILAAKRHQEGL